MSEHDFRLPAHDDDQSVADAHSRPQADGIPNGSPWSPQGPAPPPTNGQLPGLMTSAGVEPHSEMVWRDVPAQPPSLIDFDVQSLEMEKQLGTFPAHGGRGPLKSVYEDINAGRGDTNAPQPAGAVADGVDEYAAQTRKLEQDWQHLDPDAAAESLRRSGNTLLKRDGMQPLKPNKGDVPDGAQASFDPGDWAERVHAEPFKSAADVESLSENMYHELEHAHQHGSIEQLAKGVPMSPAERQATERMKRDFVDNADEHEQIESSIPGINKSGNQLSDTFHSMSPENQAIAGGSWAQVRGQLVDDVDAYYQLPSEQDAYAAEKTLKDKLGRK